MGRREQCDVGLPPHQRSATLGLHLAAPKKGFGSDPPGDPIDQFPISQTKESGIKLEFPQPPGSCACDLRGSFIKLCDHNGGKNNNNRYQQQPKRTMGNQQSSKKLDKKGRMTLQKNVVQQTNNLEDTYDISKEQLGEGSSTNIKQGTLKQYTKTERSAGVAIKLYNGKAEIQPDLKLEAEILRECDHPNIVKLFEVAKVGKQLSLVMELCSGGPVLDRCPYTEKMASRVIRQVCSAVAYLHSKQIVHRDVECSNIMFATDDKNSDIKLVDFGSATFLDMVPGHKGA